MVYIGIYTYTEGYVNAFYVEALVSGNIVHDLAPCNDKLSCRADMNYAVRHYRCPAPITAYLDAVNSSAMLDAHLIYSHMP